MEYSKFFTQIYNEYGWNYYSEIFGENLKEWLKQEHIRPEKALDLGCGTGILCDILAKNGIKTTGVDISDSMITIAKEKYPHLHFEIGDMSTYIPGEKQNLVTCVYDAINHILEADKVEKAFEKVYTCLEMEGIFIFDFLDGEKLESSEPVMIERTEEGEIQFQLTRSEDFVELKFNHICDSKMVQSDHITEKIYSREWIFKTLQNVGFTKIEFYKNILQQPDRNGCIVIAKK